MGSTSFLHKYTKTRNPTSLYLFTKHLLIILQFTRIQYLLLTLFIIDTFDLRLGPFQAVKALVLTVKPMLSDRNLMGFVFRYPYCIFMHKIA